MRFAHHCCARQRRQANADYGSNVCRFHMRVANDRSEQEQREEDGAFIDRVTSKASSYRRRLDRKVYTQNGVSCGVNATPAGCRVPEWDVMFVHRKPFYTKICQTQGASRGPNISLHPLSPPIPFTFLSLPLEVGPLNTAGSLGSAASSLSGVRCISAVKSDI